MNIKFQLLINVKIGKRKIFLALNHSDVVFILLINVKMQTIDGILTLQTVEFS